MTLEYDRLPPTRPGVATYDDAPRPSRPSRPGDHTLSCDDAGCAGDCAAPMPLVRRAVPLDAERYRVVDRAREIPAGASVGVAAELLRLGTLVESLTLRLIDVERRLRSVSAHETTMRTPPAPARHHDSDSGHPSRGATSDSALSRGESE